MASTLHKCLDFSKCFVSVYISEELIIHWQRVCLSARMLSHVWFPPDHLQLGLLDTPRVCGCIWACCRETSASSSVARWLFSKWEKHLSAGRNKTIKSHQLNHFHFRKLHRLSFKRLKFRPNRMFCKLLFRELHQFWGGEWSHLCWKEKTTLNKGGSHRFHSFKTYRAALSLIRSQHLAVWFYNRWKQRFSYVDYKNFSTVKLRLQSSCQALAWHHEFCISTTHIWMRTFPSQTENQLRPKWQVNGRICPMRPAD